jgi:hypothetical protein
MHSLEILKKLQKISADPIYTERAKIRILNTPQPRHLSVWKVIFESLEVGSAIVLAGAFLVLILGGFSGLKVFNVATLNPTTLKAEAEAIDAQISLSNLSYEDFAKQKETTVALVLPKAKSSKVSETPSAAPAPVGIDDALKALSE